MSHEFVLSCHDVSRSFKLGRDEVHVLKNIHLDVKQSDMVSIVGTSGSGKTTLLNLLAGLDDPTTGTVTMAGHQLSSLGDKQRAQLRNQQMGFVFQFHHLLPEFSALDNVLMPFRIQGKVSTEDRQYAESLLDQVGLGSRMKHRPGELSGGERQRVAVARSLVRKPAFVLMDEPTGNLDESTSESIQDLIIALNREVQSSFIIVTHNTEWAKQMPVQFKLTKGCLHPEN